MAQQVNYDRSRSRERAREIWVEEQMMRDLIRDGGVDNPMLIKRLEALLAEPVFVQNMPGSAKMAQDQVAFLRAHPHNRLPKWAFYRLCGWENGTAGIKSGRLKPTPGPHRAKIRYRHPKKVERPVWMSDPTALPKKPPMKAAT
jgi:hypothetical protein